MNVTKARELREAGDYAGAKAMALAIKKPTLKPTQKKALFWGENRWASVRVYADGMVMAKYPESPYRGSREWHEMPRPKLSGDGQWIRVDAEMWVQLTPTHVG